MSPTRALEGLALAAFLFTHLLRTRRKGGAHSVPSPDAAKVGRVKRFDNAAAIAATAGFLLMLGWMLFTSPLWLHVLLLVSGIAGIVTGLTLAGMSGWVSAGPDS